MRRALLLGAAAIVALSIVALTRGAGRSAPPTPVMALGRKQPPRLPEGPPPSQPRPEAPRNVFEYGGGAPAAPGAGEGPPRPRPKAPPAPSSPERAAVRVVGLVRTDAGPRVALSLGGQIVVLGQGESRLGYTVLDLDAEGTVRLRTPEGGEATVSSAQ